MMFQQSPLFKSCNTVNNKKNPHNFIIKTHSQKEQDFFLNIKKDIPSISSFYEHYLSNPESNDYDIAYPILEEIPLSFFLDINISKHKDNTKICDNIHKELWSFILDNFKIPENNHKFSSFCMFFYHQISGNSYFSIVFPNIKISLIEYDKILDNFIEHISDIKFVEKSETFGIQKVDPDSLIYSIDKYYPFFGSKIGDISLKGYFYCRNLNGNDIQFSFESHILFIKNIFNKNDYTKLKSLPLILLNEYQCEKYNLIYKKTKNEFFTINIPPIKFFNKEDLDDLESLLNMLKLERFKILELWLDIGNVLSNFFSKRDESFSTGFDIWKSMTSQYISANGSTPPFMLEFTNDDCKWFDIYTHSPIPIPLSIKTIAWYAMHDNFEYYTEWLNEKCKKIFIKVLEENNEILLCKGIYQKFWLDFITLKDSNSHILYHFSTYHWKCDISSIILQSRINNEILEFITEIVSCIDNENDQKKYSTNISKIKNTLNSLVNINRIVKQVQNLFILENEKKYKDQYQDLFPVANGVIVCNNHNCYYRLTKPEDFIFLKSDCKYIQYTENSPTVREVRHKFEQSFVDDELRIYFFRHLASLLRGKNRDKVFIIWSGKGNNSKSIIVRFIQEVFGDMLGKMNSSILTEDSSKVSSSSATPQLHQCMHKKVVIIDEFPHNIEPRKEKIKLYTGMDTIYSRGLYSKESENFEPPFKLICVCNEIPSIGKDEAIEQRLVIIPFLSKFIDNPPESEAEQKQKRLFKIDRSLPSKIHKYANALLWILLQYYPDYCKHGISKKPKIILQYIDDYWKNSDYLHYFFNDVINIETKDNSPDTSKFIQIQALYIQFSNWYRNCYKVGNVPNRKEFINKLKDNYSKLLNPEENTLYGISIKPDAF